MKRKGATIILSFLILLGGCAGDALDHDEIVYIAVGASDAVGVGARPITNGYVFIIRNVLIDRGRDVALVNLGIPAANTDRINGAVNVFRRTGIKAQLVTVWVGANDLIDGVEVEEFSDDLDKLLSSLEREMEAFVVIANLPRLTALPRFKAEPDPDVTEERVNRFNSVIAAEAAEREIPVVDLFGQPIENDLVSDLDGFHPNNAGHRRIAELFLEAIAAEL